MHFAELMSSRRNIHSDKIMVSDSWLDLFLSIMNITQNFVCTLACFPYICLYVIFCCGEDVQVSRSSPCQPPQSSLLGTFTPIVAFVKHWIHLDTSPHHKQLRHI